MQNKSRFSYYAYLQRKVQPDVVFLQYHKFKNDCETMKITWEEISTRHYEFCKHKKQAKRMYYLGQIRRKKNLYPAIRAEKVRNNLKSIKNYKIKRERLHLKTHNHDIREYMPGMKKGLIDKEMLELATKNNF